METLPEELVRMIILHPDDAAAIMITCKWGEQCLRGLIGKLFDLNELVEAGELVAAIRDEGRARIMESRWHITRDGKYMTPRGHQRSRWLHACWLSHDREWAMYMRVGANRGGGGSSTVYTYGFRYLKYMVALSVIESFCTNGYFHYMYNEESARDLAKSYKYPTVLFMRM